MIKKKLNILLLLLLVVLSSSLLGTTSYARELSVNDLKNFICNFAEEYYQSMSTEQIRNNLDNQTENLETWIGFANKYEGQYFIYGGGNGTTVNLVCYNASNDNLNSHFPYYYFSYDSAYIAFNNSYLNAWRWTYHINNNTFDNWVTGSSNTISIYSNITQSNLKFFLYTDMNIRNGANQANVVNGNNKYVAGQFVPNRDLFSGFYTDNAFDIDINADFRNNKATIKGDTSGTEYYLIPYNSSKIRIGNMFDYSNLQGVVKRKFRYKESIRDFELFQEFESDTNNLQYYSIVDDTLVVYEYYQPETIEFITFIPKADTGFSEFSVPIYYITDNTSITNGVIDNVVTFSGDYYNNYNNDTNTDKIINNINDDSQVDASLNEFISGDAEDIADKFGFRHYGLEFYDFIYRTITSIIDVLTADGDVYFDYSMHGETPTRIYASSFTTPNGVLKTFLQMFLISATVFVFYKNIADLFELLSTGNFYEVLDQLKVDRNIFKM